MIRREGAENKGQSIELTRIRSYRSVRDLNLEPDEIPEEVRVAQDEALISPPPARDGKEPLPHREIGARVGEVLGAARDRGCLDFLFTATGSLVGTVLFSAIPLSAMPVLGPVCGVCALGAGLYTWHNAYHGLRGPEGRGAPRSAACRAAIACATGCACVGAGAGAAVIGASPAWAHGAAALSSSIQIAIRITRSGVRDSLNAMTSGCTDSLRAVDSKGVNHDLSEPRMQRMEAIRLLCSTLCYAGLSATGTLVGTPMLAHAMGASSLSSVIDGQDFLDRWLASAPGAIVGATIEGLDGFFATVFAAASASISGNRVLIERGRGLNALAENMDNPRSTFVRALQNALMRIGCGNPVTDSQVLATVYADKVFVDAFLAFLTSDKAITEQGAAELRGKLLALGQEALAPPRQERMRDGEAQTVYVPEMQTYVTRHVEPPDHDDDKGPRFAKLVKLEGEPGKIQADLLPGSSFDFDGVTCIVTDERNGKVTIDAERAIGWVVDKDAKGRFQYTKPSAEMARDLFDNGEGIRAHDIDRFDPFMVLSKGLRQAAGIRDDKGNIVKIVRLGDDDWAVGNFRGNLRDTATDLFVRGCRARHLVLRDGAQEVAVGRRAVGGHHHMRSLLRRPGQQFELYPLAQGEQTTALPIVCTVTPSGFETDEMLPGLRPHFRPYENNGKYAYVVGRDEAATQLIRQFSVIERSTRPLDPMAAPINSDPTAIRDKQIKRLAKLLTGGKVKTLILDADRREEYRVRKLKDVTGEHIRLESTVRDKPRPHPDNSRDLAMWLLSNWQARNLSEVAEIDWADDHGTLVIRKRTRRADAVPQNFEWPSGALPADVKAPTVLRVGALDASRGDVGVEQIARARRSIQYLETYFGTRGRRRGEDMGPIPSGVSVDSRQYNQSVLKAFMRVLDGKSFLVGEVLPENGIRALLDLPSDVSERAAADLERVDGALAHGAGHDSMRSDEPTPRERSRAFEAAVAPLLPGLQELVSSYAQKWDATVSDMADAAALLAAGTPADPEARRAATLMRKFAEAGGEHDDVAALLQHFDMQVLRRRVDEDDPLQTQAIEFLEKTFKEQGWPTTGPSAR